MPSAKQSTPPISAGPTPRLATAGRISLAPRTEPRLEAVNTTPS